MLIGSKNAMLECLIKPLPDPPGAVLLAGRHLDPLEEALSRKGYRVTRCDLLKEQPRESLSMDCYLAVILKDPLLKGSPLKALVRRICKFLKPGGMAIVFRVPQIQDNGCGKGALDQNGAFLTTLYENGFSIQAKEPFMVIARKTSIYLKAYRQGDEEEILKMFEEVFATPRTMAHWYWKFRDNPFGAYRIVQAFDEGDVLAGHYSGYPVPFYRPTKPDEPFFSLQIGDIMTRPGSRNAGLGKTSVLGRITDYFHHCFCMGCVPFMYGFVAGNHRKFGERFLRYQYLSPIPYHVLDLTRRKPNKRGRFKQMLSAVRVEEVQHMDGSFDRFFHEAAGDYNLLVKRDAAYLKWRYLDCPDGGYRLFVVKRFGRLVGWSVFKKRGEAILWGDAFFRKEARHLIESLIAEMVYEQFPSARRIEGWFSGHPRWWSQILLDTGFKITAEPNGLVGGATIFDADVSLNFLNRNLYYTMGDSDLF